MEGTVEGTYRNQSVMHHASVFSHETVLERKRRRKTGEMGQFCEVRL